MNSDIALSVVCALAEQESATVEGWKWKKGIVLFPETRCPYCKDVVRSKAIWVVHGYSLIGQAVPVHGREFKLDSPSHPHATPSDICMGDAVDPLQALFNGLNPESAYIQVDGWLRGKYWRHSCVEMDEDREEDHSEEFCCARCEEWFHYDDSWSFSDDSYCEACFHRVAFNCSSCGEDYSRDERCEAFSNYYCSECF